MITQSRMKKLGALVSASATFLFAAQASAITPKPNWADSYSVNGKCYCATTFDHGIGDFKVDTPAGKKTVKQVCDKLGKGPGKGSNPVYNTVQCGHEPGHEDAIKIDGKLVKDEKVCPGRVDQGSGGCDKKGPKWDLSVYESTNSGGSSSSSSGSGSTNSGYNGKVNLPGRIQAENYTSAPSETTNGNQNKSQIKNCTYYGLNVDVEDASEGTCNVGWTSKGEKLTYKVGTAGGKFNIRVRIASAKNGQRVKIEVNGANAGSVSTNGAGWQSWTNETISNVDIPNNATITVTFVDGSANLNFLDITKASTGSGDSSSSSSSGSSSSGSSSSSSGSSSNSCTQVAWRERAEIDLNKSNCVTFARNLSGKTLAVWDTDVKSCDFRGKIVSTDGSGQVSIGKNYVSTKSLTGTTVRFDGSNSCKYVKVRAY